MASANRLAAVLHLRIVAPPDIAAPALEVPRESGAVCNIVHFEGVASDPDGDLVLADVAREDASVLIDDLKELDVEARGSISVQEIDAELSRHAEDAVKRARGAPSDAVVWEEVESRTSEATELSASSVMFMVVACLIAGVGIYSDSAILVVGAMVVGPEFGPLAGFCVAAVTRRRDMALRSAGALAAGFPAGILAVLVTVLLLRAAGVMDDGLDTSSHQLASIIASPDFFAFFVAACAGIAGVLSLSTAKSGALIGVLISVTTIPAAANVGLAAAYGDWGQLRGSVLQLVINFSAILIFGTLTLAVQRFFYHRRLRRHEQQHPLPSSAPDDAAPH